MNGLGQSEDRLEQAIREHRQEIEAAGMVRVDQRDVAAAERKHAADHRLWVGTGLRWDHGEGDETRRGALTHDERGVLSMALDEYLACMSTPSGYEPEDVRWNHKTVRAITDKLGLTVAGVCEGCGCVGEAVCESQVRASDENRPIGGSR